MKTINKIFIKFILLYKQLISPYKGYCCAYSALHGSSSCSSWAIQILEKQKISLFFPLMKRRFQACNQAHKNLEKEKSETNINSDTVDPCPCGDKKVAYCCLSIVPFSWSWKIKHNKRFKNDPLSRASFQASAYVIVLFLKKLSASVPWIILSGR